MDLGSIITDVLSQIELGDLISDSTSSIATDARDAVRVQAMSVDGGLAHLVDKVLRRRRERDSSCPASSCAARRERGVSTRTGASGERPARPGSSRDCSWPASTSSWSPRCCSASSSRSASRKYLLGSDSVDLPNTGPLLTGVGWPSSSSSIWRSRGSLTGRTFGKQLFGLRAINGDGARLGRWRACARAAWCTVFGIPSLLWAGVSSRNAAVHDIVFRTAVVYDWSERGAEPQMPVPPLEPVVVRPVVPAVEPPALSEV